MNNIRMAVLDSGISENLSEKCSIIGKKNFYYDYYSEKIITDDDIEDLNGHGSACVETILNIFQNIDFYIIKILGVSGIAHDMTLIAALEYAEKLDVDIITLCSSLTYTRDNDELRKICDRIFSAGKVIVSSVENRHASSEPANFASVIGVSGADIDDNCFSYNGSDEIQLRCSYKAAITAGSFGIRTIFQGNSRAAALASAQIARLMYDSRQNGKSLEELLTENSIVLESREKVVTDNNDLISEIPFDKEREKFFVDNEIGYHRFLYLLSEFFLYNDPSALRTEDLINFRNRKLLRKLENFLRAVEGRFGIKTDNIMLEDMTWAYVFYEKHIYNTAQRL